MGQGDGTFELRSYASGLDLRGGWGAAWADVDLDGDPDLMTSAGLYINEHSAEDKGHWLQIRPVGNVISNRAALGATVEITVGDETRIRHITGGTAQGCQDAQVAHFGLGDDDEISGIQVMYPGGDTVVYEGPFAADQRIKVFEDGGVGAPATPAPEDETPDDDASDDETPNPDAGGAE